MASSIIEEEEVAAEVEAVQAVYGDDCVVLQSYPPHWWECKMLYFSPLMFSLLYVFGA